MQVLVSHRGIFQCLYFRKRIFMFSFSSFILHSSLLSVSLSHSSALFLSLLSCVILHSHVSAHCLSHFLRCGLSLSCALLCVLSLSVLLLTLVHSCSCSCSLFFPCLHDFSYAHPLPHVCSWMCLCLFYSLAPFQLTISYFFRENMKLSLARKWSGISDHYSLIFKLFRNAYAWVKVQVSDSDTR